MLLRFALFFVLIFTSAASWADMLDLGLSNNSVRASLMGMLPQKSLGYSLDGLHNVDDGDLLSIGVHVNDRVKASTGALTSGIGAKLVGFNAKNNLNGSAVAIGGYLRQNIPGANLVSVRADAFYAPRVISWGDADHYTELGVRLEYQLVDQAGVYVGVRRIKAAFDNGSNRTLDDSAHLGLILYF